MEDVRRLAATVGGKSDDFEALADNLSSLSDKFNAIAAKIDTTMTDVNDIVSSLNEEDINELISSFHELLNNINDPEGTVGKLLNNDSIYDSVDSLLNDVDILVRKIQENPKKYIKISVF